MKHSNNVKLTVAMASALAAAAAAHAQETDAERSRPGIEEVTVTATRREESQQDVPIAISAYTAADLKASGTTTVQDLGMQTPGLTIANQSAAMTPFIRGIGAADNTVGQEAAVSTYVDGVYYPSVYGALFTFNNIERVEVLKGPQGTLFGRNATGGLIHVFTRDPSAESSLEGGLSYGNYGTMGAKLYGTTGISDSLAADIAVIYRDQEEGFGRNVTTGRDVGFVGDEFGIRSKILYTPSDVTRISLSLDYGDSKGDTGSAKNLMPGAIATADGLPQVSGYHNVRGGMHEYVDTQQWGAALHATQDFDSMSLVSISSYRDTSVDQTFDNDVTPVVFLDAYIFGQRNKTVTQELQLLSNGNSKFTWIAGLFWLKDEAAFEDPLGLGLHGVAAGGTAALIKNKIDTQSYSAFGEVGIPLGERTDLTIGARWTNDEREISGRTDITDSPVPFSNIILSFPSPSGEFENSEPSWRAVLNHHLTDDVMVYGSYNRGFKSGNFNTVSPGDAPFKSETVDAFEIGAKTQLFDNRLRLNAAAFFYSYDNLQLSSLSGSFLLTTNAADSEIKGLDLDGEWAATDNLRFRFGASYLDTEFKTFPNAQCSSRMPNGMTVQFSCDASGNRLTRSPEYTFNLGAFYTIPSSVGDFKVNATYAYNDGFAWEPDNRLIEPSYSLVNAQFGWTSSDERIGANIFAKNLFDEDYAVWTVAFALGDVYAAAPPRTYGAEVTFKF